ncbi:MAG: hypothetical protein N2322_07760, partial [Terrimicrobiaceae bacterium]|nr:hypothetical protein [Terrimicrobiaceae bacterium]
MSAEPETFSGDMFSGGGSAFDLKTFLWTARKFWWVAAIGLVGGAAAGLWLAKMEKPVYVSTAEIKVERQAGATAITLTGFPRPFESATTPEDLRTIEKSFASPALLRRVAEKIKAGGFESVKFHGREVKNLSADEVVS